MRSALLLALLIASLPAVFAQVAVPTGTYTVDETHQVPAVQPLGKAYVTLEMAYECEAFDTAMDDLRYRIEANATTRSGERLRMDETPPVAIDLDECRHQPDQVVRSDIELSLAVPDFDESDILDIAVDIRLESDEGMVEREEVDAVAASFSIPMVIPSEEPEDMQESAHEAPPARVDPQDERYVPGLSLPLAATGLGLLALLARRS